MKIYEEKRSHPMKWVLAIVVFVMALTLTFSEAFGVWLPNSGGSDNGTVRPHPDQPNSTNDDPKCPPPPPQVPEPGTLVLLGAGVAAMHLMRKKKSA